MSGIRLTAALPFVSLAIAYALKGGRSPQAFAVSVLPLLALPFSRDFRDRWLPPDPGFRPILAFLGWSVLSLAAFPPLYLHLDRLSLFATYLMFAAAAALWNEKERKAFVAMVVALGAVEAAAFVFLRLREGAYNGHLFGNPIYSALAAATALLAVPAFVEGKRARNPLFVPIAVLLTVALALTQSRSTLFGFLAAAAVVAPKRRYLTGLAVLALAAGVVCLMDPHRVMVYLKVDFARPEDVFGRFAIWKSALLATLEHPVLGWGLGNFEAGYLRHQTPVSTILRFDRSTPFAHNDFLQLAVESGWVGAGLGAWVLASLVKAGFGKARNPLGRWAFAVIVLHAVAGLFSFTLFLPYNGFVAAAAAGFLLSADARKTPAPGWLKHRLWLAVPAFLAVFVVLDGASEMLRARGKPEAGARIFPIRSDLWYGAALKSLNDNSVPRKESLERGLRQLETSLRWNDQDAFAWNRLAMVTLNVPERAPDAAGAFSRAIDLAPSHAPFWIDAGFERMRAKDAAGAEQRFRRASELEPNASLPWFALAAAAKDRGEKEKSAALLEKASSARKMFAPFVPPSGYAEYLFGMTEEQMRAALK